MRAAVSRLARRRPETPRGADQCRRHVH